MSCTPSTPDGAPLTGGSSAILATGTNTLQGVAVFSTNTTVGGPNPQENNVIIGNGQQGIWIAPGASGNQVVSNQIGLVGPLDNGLYATDGNGARASGSSPRAVSPARQHPVRIEQLRPEQRDLRERQPRCSDLGCRGEPQSRPGELHRGRPCRRLPVRDGEPRQRRRGRRGPHRGRILQQDRRSDKGLGNVIALEPRGRRLYYGAAPDPIIGIPATGTGNTVENNIIGLTADGGQILGNAGEGVAALLASNTIGPGNVISQNMLGIGIYGTSPFNTSPRALS